MRMPFSMGAAAPRSVLGYVEQRACVPPTRPGTGRRPPTATPPAGGSTSWPQKQIRVQRMSSAGVRDICCCAACQARTIAAFISGPRSPRLPGPLRSSPADMSPLLELPYTFITAWRRGTSPSLRTRSSNTRSAEPWWSALYTWNQDFVTVPWSAGRRAALSARALASAAALTASHAPAHDLVHPQHVHGGVDRGADTRPGRRAFLPGLYSKLLAVGFAKWASMRPVSGQAHDARAAPPGLRGAEGRSRRAIAVAIWVDEERIELGGLGGIGVEQPEERQRTGCGLQARSRGVEGGKFAHPCPAPSACARPR